MSTGCASSRALCPREGGRAWSEVRSEHFRLQTNLSPEVAAKSAAELEKLRRAVLLAWGPDFNPPGSLDIVLLRNTSELWEWDQKELFNQAENQQHYASAWLWVHYLINMHTERFDEFQTRLARAEAPRRAFEASFQGVNDLRGELRTYLTSGRSSFLTLPLPPVSTEVKVRELESAEVHVNRGLLFLRAPSELTREQRQEKARAELAQALAEDPNNVSAALLATQLSTNPAEHLARARELVKAHPEDGRAWDLLAEQLNGQSDVKTQEQARESAARLMPHDSRVLANLAQHYSMTLQPEKGLPVAKRAVELSPGSPFALAIQAALFSQVNRCPEAIAFQRRAVDMAHEAYSSAFRKELRDWLQRYVEQCAKSTARPTP
ncbi:hypothetical protein [Myxococcus stipitatus]|uniref:hypothetical protein n=1 Tax=Myxococcus stipitatus TaxID=83455 RepID=UPI0030CA613F